MTEHGEAVEYDLLTKTGHELRDVGDTLSWGALASFILQRSASSALSRELDEDGALWATNLKTNIILADIFDMLAQINANVVAIGERKQAKAVPKYPRPGMSNTDENTKHLGRGALPGDKLRAWFEEKRKKRNERND